MREFGRPDDYAALAHWDGTLQVTSHLFSGDYWFDIRILAHEFAHLWDFAQGGTLSGGLMAAAGASGDAPNYNPGDPRVPSNRATFNGYEDWAEAVDATLFGPNPAEDRGFRNSVRHQFTSVMICAVNPATSRHCPGT